MNFTQSEFDTAIEIARDSSPSGFHKDGSKFFELFARSKVVEEMLVVGVKRDPLTLGVGMFVLGFDAARTLFEKPKEDSNA